MKMPKSEKTKNHPESMTEKLYKNVNIQKFAQNNWIKLIGIILKRRSKL